MANNRKFRSILLKDGVRITGFDPSVGLGNSDTLVPTQKAVRTYVDAQAAGIANIANGKILIGDAQGVGQEITPTGDVTITNAGVTAIGAKKVAGSMIADGAVDSGQIANEAVGYNQLDATATLRIAKVGVVGGAQNAIAFAWENPLDVPIIVTKAIFKPITPGLTATSVMDVGATPTATDTANTLLNDVDLTASALVTTTCDKVVLVSENGGALAWVTGKILTAAAAELTGWIYIFYFAP